MEQTNGKQTGRYLRYKLAFDRLDEALLEGWLLEAISLEESIITDRLLSIMKSKGESSPTRQSFSNDLYMDEIRLTIGVARYTSDFTPPTQSFPTS